MGRSSAERGYGTNHRNLRKQVAREVRAGAADCWRCGRPIDPDEAWDLGHDDHDRSIYRGPEHRACNRGSAAVRGNQMRARKSRQWLG